jgi:hypothetical protein
MRSAYAALIGLGLGCATAPQAEAPVTLQTSPPRAKAEAPAVLPPGAAQYEPEAECTRPNVDDADGTPACVHVTPADMPPETPLELDGVRLVIAHEFGHVLGLGHSLDENSPMSHSWTPATGSSSPTTTWKASSPW